LVGKKNQAQSNPYAWLLYLLKKVDNIKNTK